MNAADRIAMSGDSKANPWRRRGNFVKKDGAARLFFALLQLYLTLRPFDTCGIIGSEPRHTNPILFRRRNIGRWLGAPATTQQLFTPLLQLLEPDQERSA